MKKIKSTLMVIIAVCCIQSFVCAEVDLSVKPDDVLCDNLLGFGAHGDYFLTCSVNIKRGVNQEDRRIALERIKELRPHIMRTFFSYRWWEPEEGKQTPDNEFIKDYVQWAKFLKDIDCKINLCPWGDYFAYSDWMNAQSRLPSPDKRAAMIRSFVDFIEFLKKDNGLTNVSYVTLMNEPVNHGTPITEFAELYKMLHEKLKERGLRKDIFLIGIDDSTWTDGGKESFFHNVIENGGMEYCDGASGHTYGQPLDLKSEYLSLDSWIKTRKETLKMMCKTPKPLMITEFSTWGDTFNNPNNHLYEHGIFLANFAITALQNGVSHLGMWCLLDTYYDSVNKQGYGLIQWKDKSWEPRPGYYAWALLTRYTQPGSKVIRVDVDGADFVKAVAFITPDDKLTVAALNLSNKKITVRLNVPKLKSMNLDCYEYSNVTIPTLNKQPLESSKSFEVVDTSTLSFEMPGNSFAVLTEIKHKTEEFVDKILANMSDCSLVFADPFTAKPLWDKVKNTNRDIFVFSDYQGFENPAPYPTSGCVLHIVQVRNIYVVEPEKGYPKGLLDGFFWAQSGPIYKAEVRR